MTPRERLAELSTILRPAGGGLYVVSTGLRAQRALQRRLYLCTADAAAAPPQTPEGDGTPPPDPRRGPPGATPDDAVTRAWEAALARLPTARAVVLGVPSDAGAGYLRGANQGPAAIREALVARPGTPYRHPDVVDLGDVRVVPQLLADDMLAPSQIAATRAALYGARDRELPVSPLDLCARALDHVRALNPGAVPLVLGGDHSVAWPAFAAAFARGRRLGLLHIDAHTDLLPERLGVRLCFATWAYHANELLQRDGRLVQVGVRTSAHPRAHWETTLGVRQYWPAELTARPPGAVADEIVERLHRRGVEAVYVSNDIDGTDAAAAGATGTPEPGGPSPAYLRALTARVLTAFPLAGADLVEVAPALHRDRPGEPARTLAAAADYAEDLLQAALAAPAPPPPPPEPP